jgi:hypothetical protein
MEQMSLSYFEKTINNSFLPLEIENYFHTLKILNLTNKDVYNFFIDMENYIKIVDGKPIPIFTNFSENLMIRSLSPIIYSKKESNKKALLNLENHLKTIFVIFENQLLLTPNPSIEIQSLEEFKKQVNDRFHQRANKNNQQLSFKGHHSFQLKNPLKTNQKMTLLNQLKKSVLICNKTNLTQIEAVFMGKVVEENNKISWNSFRDIYLFVMNLKPYLLHQNDVFETALRCFTKKRIEISNVTQLTNSSGGNKNLAKIKEIISNFESK